MLNTVNKATCRTFLCALAFASLASAQVVEKGRTFADLTATHPCSSAYLDRISRVTDCDAADDIGNGEGAFQCWATCDGSAPWAAVSIGGGAGGGAATAVQGDATLPATCTEKDLYQDTDSGGTEFYICTATNTWTKAGTIGGTLGATDDLAVCTDGTGGSTIGSCTVLNIDNLRLDGNTISSTDANGNINLTPNGTGQVVVPNGLQASPSVVFAGSLGTGIYASAAGALDFATESLSRAYVNSSGLVMRADYGITGTTTSVLTGFNRLVQLRTNGSGSPLDMSSGTYGYTVQTNEGATAEVYVTLPPALSGTSISFVVQDADGIRITAAAGDTIRPIAGTAASATGGFIRCATQGAFITLIAINVTEWVAIGSAGTWTIDI